MNRVASSYRPRPPSTERIWPVMKWGPVAKKRTAAATSSAEPLRRMGVRRAKCSNSSATSPLTIMPGATQFTLISGAQALDMVRVSMCRAALEVQ
jgi:hypothetical protein